MQINKNRNSRTKYQFSNALSLTYIIYVNTCTNTQTTEWMRPSLATFIVDINFFEWPDFTHIYNQNTIPLHTNTMVFYLVFNIFISSLRFFQNTVMGNVFGLRRQQVYWFDYLRYICTCFVSLILPFNTTHNRLENVNFTICIKTNF